MWDRISVGKFQQLHDIIAGQQFENEVEKRIHLLACLEDKEPEFYEGLPIQEALEQCRKTSFLSYTELPKVSPPRTVTINGRAYRIVYECKNLTAGQFIDAVNETKNQEEQIMRMNRILASLAVPEGGKYGDIDFDQVADDMLQVSILEAQAIALFFYSVWNEFLKGIPAFLIRKVRKEKKGTTESRAKLEAALMRVGVGLPAQPK